VLHPGERPEGVANYLIATDRSINKTYAASIFLGSHIRVVQMLFPMRIGGPRYGQPMGKEPMGLVLKAPVHDLIISYEHLDGNTM
jgi:hypothetical protein